MRRHSLAFMSALGLVLATPQPSSAETAPAIGADAIRADIGFLADDLLEGRDAGTRGYDIAARYVAARFEALGLRQIIPDSWYQPVTRRPRPRSASATGASPMARISPSGHLDANRGRAWRRRPCSSAMA
jgi:hypothetical protein